MAAAAAAVVAAVVAADVAQSEHAAAAAVVVAAVAVVQAEADSVGEVAGCESLDDARSCFHGGALQLLETQHAQRRDTGGCCHPNCLGISMVKMLCKTRAKNLI